MTAKTPNELIEKAIELYNELNPLRVCAIHVGVNQETLRKHFKKRGVKMRKTTQGIPANNRITNLPETLICEMYIDGKSENFLSHHYKISRPVIRRILLRNGTTIRSQSQAEYLKWEGMTKDARQNQVRLAHDACRGRVRSQAELNKMAISRQENFSEHFVGIGEPELKNYFIKNQIDFEYQRACLSYNLDFLVKGIDLELTGSIGRNQPSNSFVYQRAKNVYSQGYKTLYIEFIGVDRLIDNAPLILNLIDKINNGAFGDGYYILLRLFEGHHSVSILN